MGFQDMRELPHIIKPATLALVILQTFFVFFMGHRSFQWFVILTTILQLVFTIIAFVIFGLDIQILQAGAWNMGEMVYAAVFCIFDIINAFYFFINLFKHFDFFCILGTGTAVFLTLAWGLDAIMMFRSRGVETGSSSATNQATATPAPAPGATTFPSYPAGHAGSNPA